MPIWTNFHQKLCCNTKFSSVIDSVWKAGNYRQYFWWWWWGCAIAQLIPQNFIFQTWFTVSCLLPINYKIFHCCLHSLLSFVISKWIFKNWRRKLERIIVIVDNKKLILENLPPCFQVPISFSSYLWQTVENTLIAHRKCYSYLLSDAPFPQKWSCSQNCFSWLF